jgi:hypothetical protein
MPFDSPSPVLTPAHREWLDRPNNYGAFVAGLYFDQVDVVMSGLCRSCMKDLPILRYLACENQDEKCIIAAEYKRVRVHSPDHQTVTANSRFPGYGDLSSMEGLPQRSGVSESEGTFGTFLHVIRFSIVSLLPVIEALSGLRTTDWCERRELNDSCHRFLIRKRTPLENCWVMQTIELVNSYLASTAGDVRDCYPALLIGRS